jgi:thiamine-phosphate pyrophosphorylase
VKTPILCYVTDRSSLSPAAAGSDPLRDLLARIQQAARAGVDWVQLREKDLDGRILFDLAAKAVSAGAAVHDRPPARIFVNDRLDVAWAAHCSGVHLGENSLPLSEVIRWRGQVGRSDFLVGVSCHSLEAAVEAAAGGADYVFFGPVFVTPSKRAFGAPQGLQKLSQVCGAVSIPVLAIGGITAQNAVSCGQAGASGIAAIRLFQQAPDLPALLRKIRP